MAQDAIPTITFTPGAGGNHVSCDECGAMVEPGQQQLHTDWHATLRAEAGTWVLPTGIQGARP